MRVVVDADADQVRVDHRQLPNQLAPRHVAQPVSVAVDRARLRRAAEDGALVDGGRERRVGRGQAAQVVLLVPVADEVDGHAQRRPAHARRGRQLKHLEELLVCPRHGQR